MRKWIPRLQLYFFMAAILLAITANAAQIINPLPSWNDGSVKQSIIQFVENVTGKTNAHYVPPENRIATIDNDGTLWLEQPLYTQAIFAIDRVKALASKHPEWKKQKPYSAILSDNKQEIAKLTTQDFEQIIAVTHTGTTVDDFRNLVQSWLATAKNPRYNRPYTQLVYQPMLEVINYLRQNNFKIYIVSGGGQDFMRAFAQQTYGITPNHVIGTTFKTKYSYQSNQSVLIKMPAVLLVSDSAGKPEAINLFIGQKPIIAFGNSDGDRQMLEWTQSGSGARLMLLVHHDDAKREYAYGPQSKVGTFSDSLMTEANQRAWKVISMQHDWKVIFPS